MSGFDLSREPLEEAARRAAMLFVNIYRGLERLLLAAGFRVLPDGELSIPCARWERGSASARDALQVEIARRVVATGRAWLATTRHFGETWLRMNIVNLYTEERYVRALSDLVSETARACAPA